MIWRAAMDAVARPLMGDQARGHGAGDGRACPLTFAPIDHAIGPVIVRVPRPKLLRPFVSRVAPWRIKVTILLPAAAARYGSTEGAARCICQPYGRGRRPQRRLHRYRPGIDRAEGVVLRRGTGVRRPRSPCALNGAGGWCEATANVGDDRFAA